MFQLTDLKPVFQKTTASKTEKSIQENCTNTENSDNTNTSPTSSEPSSSDKQSDTDNADVEAKRDKTAETQSDTLTDLVITSSLPCTVELKTFSLPHIFPNPCFLFISELNCMSFNYRFINYQHSVIFSFGQFAGTCAT